MSSTQQMVCVSDFESYVAKFLPKPIYDFVKSGAERECTTRDNVEAFKRYRLLPCVLKDVSTVDMTTTILGHRVDFPVGIAPVGTLQMAHHDGERAVAKAAAEMNTVYTLSAMSTTSMDDITNHAGDACRFFQMYVTAEIDSRPVTRKAVRMAEEAGYRAIVLTVDTPVHGVRWDNMRNKFLIPAHLRLPIQESLREKDCHDVSKLDHDRSLTWKTISWLKSITKLPLVLKGIMAPADAAQAAELGVAAVWVSNHGGRQLDTTPATLDVLGPIVSAVNGRCEVYMDGGIRCGTDVFKALALGATFVFIGRPAVYGLAYGGEDGVKQILEMIRTEFSVAMALSGCSKLKDISMDHVVHQSQYSARL